MTASTPTFHRDSSTDEVLAGLDLSGKTYLITGGGVGLGMEAARALAARGASVIITSRCPDRADAALATLRERVPGARFEARALDLASLASVRRFTEQLAADGVVLDGILGNAGIMATDEGRTECGFELQFGSNHLGHFLLVNRLLPLARRGAGARVVMMSSGAHRLADVDLEDPNFLRRPYDRWDAYGQSKSANALFAVALDHRWRDHGLRAFVVAPGIITGTNLHTHLDDSHFAVLLSRQPEIVNLKHKTLEAGVSTMVYALAHPGLAGRGAEFLEDCTVAPLNEDSRLPNGVMPRVLDAAKAEAVWALSERLVGECFAAPAPRVGGATGAAIVSGLDGNRLPASARWRGQTLALQLDEGGSLELAFDDADGCRWRGLPGFHLAAEGRARADVIEAAPGVFFIDLLLDEPQDQTMLIAADIEQRRALVVATRMNPRTPAAPSRFEQRFSTAVVGGPGTVATGPVPAPTADLTGKRALYVYDDTTSYEHVYLNANWYAYQSIGGARRGDAGCDEASFYKLRDGVYVVTWRELLIDIAAVFVYDMAALQTTGKAWGTPQPGGPLLNIPAGAKIVPLTGTGYPARHTPV
ncbi:MAG: SDR family NAD(P)-dependent oxidoreductase [Rubrivivax sp.]|nr:SDR family NAD(P)-dependent oxidoreductase [Rubrivivax sp.]